MPTMKIGLCIAMVLGTVSVVLARTPAPTQPYGSPSQLQRCAANMESSLDEQSLLRSQDTSPYIHYVQDDGVSEYDREVWHCMRKFYREYRAHHGTRTDARRGGIRS